MDVQFLCISMCGHYSDTNLDYTDNVQIVFGSIFIYYSHCIQIRTLYSQFMHIICMMCIWYSDYSQHYLQTEQTWLPDLITGQCVDLVLFTGGGAAPAFFSSAFLFSHSSFSLRLCSSTASLVLSFFFSSSSFAPLAFRSSLAEKERERNVEASDAHYYNCSK